ncbi:loricrin-like [Coffea eugenioides]|uniref:loricrin-like n=1 Tax=Coffea eugenioides TaxID=49369 RepID=UPI000F609667|nr:loricrin-like [Coffea eugenioides]
MGGKGGSSGGNSGGDNGGGNGSSCGSGLSKGGGNGGAGGGYIKAPGNDRSYISRVGFEANPQLYISGVHVIKIEEHLEMDNKGCSKETGAGAAGAGGGNSSGGGTNKGGNNDLVMKAPGGDGAYLSRTGFESDPKGYFSDLHAKEKVGVLEEEPKAVEATEEGKEAPVAVVRLKARSGSVGAGGGYMKAPGGGGSYISRAGFEANPRGYFSGLRGGQKGK